MKEEEKLLKEEKRFIGFYIKGMYSNDLKKLSDAFIVKYIDCFCSGDFICFSRGKKKRSSKVWQLILDKLYEYCKTPNDNCHYLSLFFKELILRKRLSKRFLEKNKDKIPQSVWEDFYI